METVFDWSSMQCLGQSSRLHGKWLIASCYLYLDNMLAVWQPDVSLEWDQLEETFWTSHPS